MPEPTPPPDGLWLFDGVCNFCSGSVATILRLDRAGAIRFTPIQSAYGAQLAQAAGIDPTNPTSFLFYHRGQALEKSAAILALHSTISRPAGRASTGSLPPSRRVPAGPRGWPSCGRSCPGPGNRCICSATAPGPRIRLRRADFPGLGRRWLALAKTPDLDLLVARYHPHARPCSWPGWSRRSLHLGLWLNSSLADNREDILAEAKDYGLDMPILKDADQKVGEQLNVQRTAEVIVINPKTWQITYRGPLDDKVTYERQRVQAEHPWADEAIADTLAGKPVAVAQRQTEGCIINFPDRDAKRAKISQR